MTFDAGSIEATLDLDRSPFERGLNEARRSAKVFEATPIKAKLDIDVRDIARARAELRALAREGATAKVKVKVDTTEAEKGTAAVRSNLRGIKKDAEQAGASFHPLLDSITLLGPALIPLASGLTGIAAAGIGIGGTLVLGIKGASKEMKDGTPIGREYSATIKTLGTDVNQLQRTAARGILKPFLTETATLNRQMPKLNQDVAKLSATTGDILGHGANALLNLFTAAEPLIEKSEAYVDKLFTRLDHWSSSGDAKSFFDALAQDMPVAVEAIGNIASVLAGLITGLAPVGRTMLDIVNDVTGLVGWLEKIPGLVTAGATAWIVYRTSALLSVAANKLLGSSSAAATAGQEEETIAMRGAAAAALAEADALDILAASTLAAGRAAEAAALTQRAAMIRAGAGGAGAGGAATAGLLGRAGGLATKALPWLLAAYIGGSTELNATKGAENSNSHLARGANAGGDFLGDFFSGKWGFGDVRADFAANDAVNRRQAEQRAIDARNATLYSQPVFAVQRPKGFIGPLAPTRLSANDQYYAGAGRYAMRQNSVNQSLLGQVGGLSDPKAIASANDAITASIQKRKSAEDALFDTSKGALTLNGGLVVSEQAYYAEMEKTGNNLKKTTEYFKAHSQAQQDDTDTLNELQDRSARYSAFLTDTSVKYKVGASVIGVYAAALGLTYSKITQNNASEREAAKLIGAVNDKFANGRASLQGWLASISQVDLTTDSLTQRVGILGAGLTALRGDALNVVGANLSAVGAIEGAANAIDKNSASVSRNGNLLGRLRDTAHGWIVEQPKLTAGSLEIQQAMSQAATSAVTLAQSIYQNTGNAQEAFAAYEGLRSQFISTEIQSGKTSKAAHKLADEIYGVPKDAKTFVKLLGKDDVAGAIRSLTSQLGGFSKLIAKALVGLNHDQFDTDYNNVLGKIANLKTQHVTIPVNVPGIITTPGNAPVTGKNKGSTYGSQVPGGAARGWIVDVGTTPTADDVPVRVSKGEAIIPADKVSRHPNLMHELVYGGGYASGYVPPSLITNDGGGSGGGSGSGSGSNALAALAKLLTDDLPKFSGLASAYLYQIRGTLKSISGDLQKVYDKGYVGKGTIRQFANDSTRLISDVTASRALASQITKNQSLLGNVTSERTSVRDAVLGQFDIGQSGNGYSVGIMDSLDKSVNDTKKFAALRAKAKSLGLDPKLLQQITEEGPAVGGANLAAIVKGGKGYVTGLDAKYAELRSLSGSLGDTQTKDTYGTTQSALTKKIATEVAEQKAYSKKISADVHDLRTIVKDLARNVAKGRRTA